LRARVRRTARRRLEGKSIYVRWKPSAFVLQPFKVGGARAMIALRTASSHGGAAAAATSMAMVPNIVEALAEMVELGQGLLSGAEPLR
jgi:hypothetical protein